ncbi:MAG TPA: hypothetical protein VFW83_07695, partial [Bryobacteraceae bacterium]|nr:hypothetical protein [Bryobacteraceae bacterium]
RRVLRSGGVVCHIIDPSDHWSHADQSISRVNFLKYPDSLYGLAHVTNKLNYHNRLRHSEYVHLMNRAGFEMLREERNIDQRSLLEISSGRIKVAPRWRGFNPEDLATVDTFLLARGLPAVSNNS